MSVPVPTNPSQDKCPKCGASLAAGLCRQCLLLAGMQDTSLPVGATTQESLIGRLFPELAEIRPIGRGGMGVVYRARQRDVDRDIALKLLPLEMTDAPDAEERFEVEARAAARLDHPHIITLYEFGERGGSLFLKMKLVENGRSLAHALKERSPWPAKDAVALLIKLACAVHHAHQHGIIHRDIKPGNVLLDPQGEPLLSDFGLARIVEENTSLTHSRMVLGTASYMAPEQADGKRSVLTTAADVYSLGAVLYEMLTGRPPFDGASTAEILRHVIEDDPAPPCVLSEGVDRDLSTICLKCLEKNPARRYGSAEALAEDLGLWQQGRPISARPISTAGRISKWARRRPAVALLTSALAASVIIGSTLAIWQAVRATRAERSAKDEAAISKAVNDFINSDLFGSASPDHEPDRDMKVRTVLDRADRRIGNRFQDQPLVEAAIRLTMAGTYDSLGEYEKAQQHAERSAELRLRILGPEHPDTLKSRGILALALKDEGKFAQAELEGRAVLKIQERVLGPEHPETLLSRMNLADSLRAQGKYAELEAENRAILHIRERVLGAEHPDTLNDRMNLAIALRAQGKIEEAETEHRAVIKVQERVLGPEHPDTLRSWHNLANALNAHGLFAQAEAEHRAVLKIQERVLGAEHSDTLKGRMDLATTLSAQCLFTEAKTEYLAVLRIQERVLGPEHPETLRSRINLTNVLKAQRKFAEVEIELRAVLKIQERVLGPEHPDILMSLNNIAFSLQQQDQLDEARDFARRAMEGRRKVLGATHPDTVSSEKLYEELSSPKMRLPATESAATPVGESPSLAVIPTLGNVEEWSRFRGPNGSGVAEASHLPATLDASHTVWRIDIGRGVSSPVGWKGRLFLTSETAPGKRAVICLDSRDGKELWRYERPFTNYSLHPFDSFAASTPFVDTERVYVNWRDGDSVEALALDHYGKLLWINLDGANYVSTPGKGASSPVVSDGVMAVRAEIGTELDGKAGGASEQPSWKSSIVGLDAATGTQKWKLEVPRATSPNSTPVVRETGSKHEFILADSASGVIGIDAASGTMNWQHNPGYKQHGMGNYVLKEDILFATFGATFGSASEGKESTLLRLGFGKPQEMETKIIKRLPSWPMPLLVGDRLYLLRDSGILNCMKFPSGEDVYGERLSAAEPHGEFLSSPVAADGKIYCASRSGHVFVVKLRDKFEVVAINKLDGGITATPAIAWNHLFVRTDKSLYCFGEKDAADPVGPARQPGAAPNTGALSFQ